MKLLFDLIPIAIVALINWALLHFFFGMNNTVDYWLTFFLIGSGVWCVYFMHMCALCDALVCAAIIHAHNTKETA